MRAIIANAFSSGFSFAGMLVAIERGNSIASAALAVGFVAGLGISIICAKAEGKDKNNG